MVTEKTIISAVDDIFAALSFPSDPRGLYEPLEYMIRIGGKRIRPTLCITAYSVFKDKIGEEVKGPAEALEIFHSFTLIHDDIMDRSPLRRGEPTVWKKWSPDTAILSGDVMLIEAYKHLTAAPLGSVHPEVMKLFSETAAQVCEGQQYDMEFESRDDVGMDEYCKMIGLKTAVLLACSAKMGALVAGASREACDAMYDYGYRLGMAFQVADDYLDAFGDEKVFGKPIGGDILNCKKSWLTVRSLEKLSGSGRDEFLRIFKSTDMEAKEKVAAIKDIYLSLGIDRDARREVERYSELAGEAASLPGVDTDRLALLHRFTDMLTGRAR